MGAEAATPPAVLLVPFPAQGHVTPMLHLARAGHRRRAGLHLPPHRGGDGRQRRRRRRRRGAGVHPQRRRGRRRRRPAGFRRVRARHGAPHARAPGAPADGAPPRRVRRGGRAGVVGRPRGRAVRRAGGRVLARDARELSRRGRHPGVHGGGAHLRVWHPSIVAKSVRQRRARPGQDASSPQDLAGRGRAEERRAAVARGRLGHPEIEVRVLAPGSPPRAELPFRPRQLLPRRGRRCRRRRRRPPGAAGPAGLPGGAAAGGRRPGQRQRGAANERRRPPGGTVQAAAQHVAGRLDVHRLAGQATCGVSGVRLVRQLGGADRAREDPRARAGAGGHRPAVPVGAQEGPVVARGAPRRLRREGGRRRPRQGGRLGAAGGGAHARLRWLLPHALRLELHRRGHTARGAAPVLPRLRGPVHQLRVHHSGVGDRDQARRRHEQRRGEGLHREVHGSQGREASAGEDGRAEGESRDGRREEFGATERQVLRERN